MRKSADYGWRWLSVVDTRVKQRERERGGVCVGGKGERSGGKKGGEERGPWCWGLQGEDKRSEGEREKERERQWRYVRQQEREIQRERYGEVRAARVSYV